MHQLTQICVMQVNTQTIRFGNPTYLQPITLLGEENAEKANKVSTPLLDKTSIERYENENCFSSVM